MRTVAWKHVLTLPLVLLGVALSFTAAPVRAIDGEGAFGDTGAVATWFRLNRSVRPALVLSAVTFPEATCNESVFKPCVCASKVPAELQYRPELAVCGGKAAVILRGSLRKAFSVVMRDRANRDRYAKPGYNGCTPADVAQGLARCSYYKVAKTFRTAKATTFCFPFSGLSNQLSKATRLTIKLKDVPNATTDPLQRVCLAKFSAKNPIN